MTLDQSLDLAKNQSVLRVILHDLLLYTGRLNTLKRQVILGTCLACLIQTGSFGYGVSNASAEVTSGSGNNLLFGSKTGLSQPSPDLAAPAIPPETISEIETSTDQPSTD